MPRCKTVAFLSPPGGRAMLAPTSATHQRVCHCEGRQARGNLPVQFDDHIGTDIEATPYREIPTDGIAVLGMTYFCNGCPCVYISCPEGRGRSMTAPTWSIVPLCRGGVPPPANGTGNPSPTSATHIRQHRRAGPWSRRKGPPCAKGAGFLRSKKTGGLFCIVPLQSLRHFLTKMPPPFAQGRLSGGR